MPELNVSDELSLQDFEGDDWGDPETGETGLIKNVLQYRRLPLGDLGVEELRELILQQVSLDVLVPRALPILERDPRAAGDLYEGDLLSAVLLAKRGFWARHPQLAERVEGIIAKIPDDPDEIEVDLTDDIAKFRAAAGRTP